MLKIDSAVAMADMLTSPLPDKIKKLLTLRHDQLLRDTNGEYDIGELAHWVVVAQGDTLPAIEAAVRYPILPDPPWEWVIDQAGIFEAPVILSDDGFGVILIVPDEEGVDPELLSLLRRDAQREIPGES